MGARIVCPRCSGYGEVNAPSATVDQELQDRARAANDSGRIDTGREQTSRDAWQRAIDRFHASDGQDHPPSRGASATTPDAEENISNLEHEATLSRLEAGEHRDHAAELRDRGAEGRDLQARMREVLHDDIEGAENLVLRAGRDRAKAADDRARAAADRASAAVERDQAAHDRADALRAQSETRRDAQHNLALAAEDEVTGALTRAFGLTGASHELDRASRTGGPLVLASIDLDHLDGSMQANDQAGRDKLLRFVGDSLKANLRSYDLIVRYGENSFLCAMPSIHRSEATRRLTTVAAVLAAADKRHAITFGLAEYEPADELLELIGRADEDLHAARSASGR